MKNIITIQHPESVQHKNGMIGSWCNWELTDLGLEQASKIGKKLSEELKKEYVLYTSDLLRTKQTAEIVSSYFGIKPTYTESLREFNLGEAVGNSKEWAANNNKSNVWPGTIDWGENIDDKPFKGCESKREVWGRLTQFLKLIMSSDDENIIIVSHDGTLSILFTMWLGLNVETLNGSNLSGKKAGVSFLREDEKGNRIIDRLNDLSYIL
ncbi:MAG: histidine phosphatase family protein [Clostridiales bacterium]|nr:histidine phosphatase family protein [Clostridiales bacterium]